jgi:hypothetical protein
VQKCHAMKEYREVEVELPSCLTSARDEDEMSVFKSVIFSTG